ncbi:hypothetical protein J8655_09935 [Dickeya oryzae]|uniref:hypothetical protein n=1 Tax=Dickeya oryzae TaxID=1240404 RepID=UPI001AEC8E0E|nr:hypothetical protein [Dickeya oryzae]MBP2845797.1 hypothetical protein [Dickeya oryzae]
MKISSIKTVRDFMTFCKMPGWEQRTIRDMKVGDTFMLGKYSAPGLDSIEYDTGYIAEAWIEKERGHYSYFATFTLPTKITRPFIMMHDEFTIRKGGLITFKNGNDAIRLFSLVSRYLNQIVLKSTTEERQRYRKAGTKPYFRGVWMDKNNHDRRVNVFHDGEKLVRRIIDYSNHTPTHQLQAIVAAGLLQKLI